MTEFDVVTFLCGVYCRTHETECTPFTCILDNLFYTDSTPVVEDELRNGKKEHVFPCACYFQYNKQKFLEFYRNNKDFIDSKKAELDFIDDQHPYGVAGDAVDQMEQKIYEEIWKLMEASK